MSPEIVCPYYGKIDRNQPMKFIFGDTGAGDLIFSALAKRAAKNDHPGVHCPLQAKLDELANHPPEIGSGVPVACRNCGNDFTVTRTQ
jgi:hypothetical protein